MNDEFTEMYMRITMFQPIDLTHWPLENLYEILDL